MPKGLRRFYGKGDLHFITFSCYQRLPLLKSARAQDIFVEELAKLREELGFRLIGYVVMPEHVHVLMSEPKCGTSSTVPRKLKLRVRKLHEGRKSAPFGQMHLPFETCAEPLHAFWQARFYDFNVYSERKRIEKLNYMHAHPMIRRLVKHPKDWPWSSWGFYARSGKVLVQMDVER